MTSKKLTSLNVPVIEGKTTARLRLEKGTDIGNVAPIGQNLADDTACLFSFHNVGTTQYSFALKMSYGSNPSSARSDLIPFVALQPGGYHSQLGVFTGEFLEITGGTGNGNIRMNVLADAQFISTPLHKHDPNYPSVIEYTY